jgi:hypothetical protein
MFTKLTKKRSKLALILVGLVSLIWFLIRVIPKPGRALYPCQRAAFPFASAFIIWIFGLSGGKCFYDRARRSFKRTNYLLVVVFLTASLFFYSIITIPFSTTGAAFRNTGMTDFEPADQPNTPVGVARGIFPGRVVWCYNPNATNWSGIISKWGVDGISGATDPDPGGDWFNEGNIIQSQVDGMISETIRKLTEKSSDILAWDAIFKYFNSTHQKGNIGYQQGEKIAVKINLNNSTSHATMNGCSNISPQMVLGLLRQLVINGNVAAGDITFYDVSRQIPSTIYDLCKGEYPDVKFVDQLGGDGRIKGVPDLNNQIHWSKELILEPLANPAFKAYIPTCVTGASYIINLANLKAHSLAGISLCTKNMLGSFITPDALNLQPPQAAGIHPYLAVRDYDGYNAQPMESYNALVDLMGDNNLGGKTLLYLIDGLFAANSQWVTLDYRCKWKSAPFNGNWTSSFFASLDNLAIESVCLDFLRAEQAVSEDMTHVTGNVDNYLHEAALANNPPSGIFYHPNGTPGLGSLGVHEHWNNSADKSYTRNLGTGQGIELIPIIHPWISTAIKQGTENSNPVVFPNPASGIIKVRFSNGNMGEGKLEIFNLNGVLLGSTPFYKDSFEFIREFSITGFKGTLILKISIKNFACSKIITNNL